MPRMCESWLTAGQCAWTHSALNNPLTPYLDTGFTLIGMATSEPEQEKLTISRLAHLGGVNLETIRYYERQGLLPSPPRTAAGYRVFPREAARRLRFIKRAQELGFSLNEISELLELRMKPGAKQADIRMRAEVKIADIEQKIRTLQAMKKTLRQLTERCDGCGALAECPILQTFNEEITE